MATGLVLCWFYFKRKQALLEQRNHSDWMMLRRFSFTELERLTLGFQTTLGEGSCGVVYKGTTVSAGNSETIEIAVKRLKSLNQTAEKEFMNEVTALGQARHRNLVRLLGFCDDGVHRLLVYEFLNNGSLTNFLFHGARLKWKQRMQIACGIARGLLYLHEECDIPIIHCDIKPENILLDQLMSPKICDFGMVKLLKIDQTMTTTVCRGTRGYFAPEWFKPAPITAKVDVYSYGVLLLEIVCLRRNLMHEYVNTPQHLLTNWAYDCYMGGRLYLLAENDKQVVAEDAAAFQRMVMLALWCIQEDLALRPSMSKVVLMLEEAVPIPQPIPDPSTVQFVPHN